MTMTNELTLPELLAECRHQATASGNGELVKQIDRRLRALGPQSTETLTERGELGRGTVQERLFRLESWAWWRGATGEVMGAIHDAGQTIENLGGEKKMRPMEML